MVIDFALLVAVIIALGEVIKRVGLMNPKYLPLVNMAFGIFGGILYLDGDIKNTALQGLIIGLVASGIFDLTKFAKK